MFLVGDPQTPRLESGLTGTVFRAIFPGLNDFASPALDPGFPFPHKVVLSVIRNDLVRELSNIGSGAEGHRKIQT